MVTDAEPESRPSLAAEGTFPSGLDCRAFVELEIEGRLVDWCGLCGASRGEHPAEDPE